MIKKLDWYIFKRFLVTFFVALLLIIGIVIIFDISEKIDGFMDIISCYDILEVCRTGITGISRVDEALIDAKDRD